MRNAGRLKLGYFPLPIEEGAVCDASSIVPTLSAYLIPALARETHSIVLQQASTASAMG